MEYSFWKLKANPVRIVKYWFAFINIDSVSFHISSVDKFIQYYAPIPWPKKCAQYTS